jgi:hypothetical protein
LKSNTLVRIQSHCLSNKVADSSALQNQGAKECKHRELAVIPKPYTKPSNRR